jgi:hypothetical protein
MQILSRRNTKSKGGKLQMYSTNPEGYRASSQLQRGGETSTGKVGVKKVRNTVEGGLRRCNQIQC